MIALAHAAAGVFSLERPCAHPASSSVRERAQHHTRHHLLLEVSSDREFTSVFFFCIAGRFACISIIQSLYQKNGSIRFQCACRGVCHRLGDEKAPFHDLSTVFYRSGSNPSRDRGPPPRHASGHDRRDGCGALRASRDPDFVPTCRLPTDTTQTVSIARSLLCCPLTRRAAYRDYRAEYALAPARWSSALLRAREALGKPWPARHLGGRAHKHKE